MAGPGDDVTLTFGGNATTLLRLGQFTLLTDPNFIGRGQRVYLGKGLWTRRLTDPAILPEDLPDLDAVLLSHLHGDHWDRIAYATIDRDTPVITPQAASRTLTSRGFRATADLRPWQVHEIGGDGETLRVTPAPGGRGPGSAGGGPAPRAGARERRRRRDAADHLRARRARPRTAGEDPAPGHGQRAGAGPRRRGDLARLHHRRHAPPAVAGRGAPALRAARRRRPPPGRPACGGPPAH